MDLITSNITLSLPKPLIIASATAVSIYLVRYAYTTSYLWTFAFLSLFQFTAFLTYQILIYPYLLSPIRHIPGPKSDSWFMGSFPTTFREPAGAPHIRWLADVPNNGLIRYTDAFNEERLLPTNSKVLQEVLHTKCYLFVKPKIVKFGPGLVLGTEGLLFAEGEVHKNQRKLILPAFSHAHIKNLVPIFWSKSHLLAEKLTTLASSASFSEPAIIEMSRWTSQATLDIIGAAGFGYEFRGLESADDEEMSELAKAYTALTPKTRGATALGLLALVFPGWIIRNLPFKRNAEVVAAIATVRRVAGEIINQRRCEAKKSSDESEKDILSVILESGGYEGPEAESVLKDQMLTFLAAGHETTATASVWGLHILSQKKHHAIQTRLRAEIRETYPNGLPESITYQEVEKMKYLRNVSLEILRIFPPVPMTMRIATEDTTINEQFVPKGTKIAIVPWAINTSKSIWGETADQFDPDRWDTSSDISNYAFMTFLAGQRGCIGIQFAKVEFKVLLIALLGRFEYKEVVEGRKVGIKNGITARPAGGMELKVSIVEGW